MTKLLLIFSAILSLGGCFRMCFMCAPALDIDEIRPKAERGDALAQYQMGLIYKEGYDNQPVDYDKAIYWFHKGYQSGEVRAAYQLGLVYSDTEIATEDFQIVTYWMRKAAEQGEYYAQRDLTDINLSGKRVPQNAIEASYWLKKRANEFCDEKAYEQLGDLYYEGTLEAGDYTESFDWYLKAAQKSQTNAMVRLADMYAEGKGVPMNWFEAYVWYTKAYQRRWSLWSPCSEARCGRLTESLAIAEQHLTKEQLELGRQRANDMKLEAWYPPSCEEPELSKFFEEIKNGGID